MTIKHPEKSMFQWIERSNAGKMEKSKNGIGTIQEKWWMVHKYTGHIVHGT
jgi:hypothetical protein